MTFWPSFHAWHVLISFYLKADDINGQLKSPMFCFNSAMIVICFLLIYHFATAISSLLLFCQFLLH